MTTTDHEANAVTVVTDGSGVLDDVRAFVRKYVSMTDAQADTIALFVAHTYAVDAAETSPYLNVSSAEKESGKTRLLEVLEQLVNQPLLTSSISEAALFRYISDSDRPTKPCLLFDEVDAIFGPKARDREDLRSLLNQGYRRGAMVVRCAPKTLKVEMFEAFCPKVLAGLGRIPDTIASRSVPVRLIRKRRAEQVASFYRRDVLAEAEPIRQRVALWASEHVPELSLLRPTRLDDLRDRANDIWEPLLAIGAVAGGDWPARAHAAAVELSGGSEQAEESFGIRLLADVRTVYEERDVVELHSAALVDALLRMEDAPWAESGNGRGLTQNRLARLLDPYAIEPHAIRIDGKQARGYRREQFAEAWERFLPGETVTPSPGQSPSQETRESEPSHGFGGDGSDSALWPLSSTSRDGVTVEVGRETTP